MQSGDEKFGSQGLSVMTFRESGNFGCRQNIPSLGWRGAEHTNSSWYVVHTWGLGSRE